MIRRPRRSATELERIQTRAFKIAIVRLCREHGYVLASAVDGNICLEELGYRDGTAELRSILAASLYASDEDTEQRWADVTVIT